MNRQLYRSRNNRMIAGVCGGIGDYFNIDPTIVRILWAAFSIFSAGAGIVAYIIALIVIPEEGYGSSSYDYNSRPPVNIDSKNASIIIGGVLVLLGILLLGRRFFSWFDFRLIWPLVLIALGVLVIFRGWRK